MADIRAVATVKSPARATADSGFLGTRATRAGELFTADLFNSLAMQGRIFYATPGAAQNTVITGVATAFAATTPDFTLEAPTGTTCMPLRIQMTQAGTIAGGPITVVMAIQNAAERSSVGTVFPNILSSRTDGQGAGRNCIPYTAPTVASDTVGVGIFRTILTQTVTTGRAGGLATDIDFQPFVDGTPIYLVGPAALKIYTWAGTTAPSWFIQMAWAEIPTSDIQ